jgi:ADP-ribosyl-[dinitrogen reductase] hydrolase
MEGKGIATFRSTVIDVRAKAHLPACPSPLNLRRGLSLTSSIQPMLEQALVTARDAALEAGAVLRAEFHRPGGPRGHYDKAGVDDEVELVLRGRLLGAFPRWGFIGEETGPGPFPDRDSYWAVDPNDGTIWFLKGWRGSSVSIGLVSSGTPVLGVVFAFAAPDDRGDLFTWAEGQPLLRNGKPLPPLRDDPPGPRTIVFHSPAAGRNPLRNARLCLPGRFLTSPGIAYRLALTAAGEGNVAVSVNCPNIWDLAGGHALLLAAGGDIWSDRGERIRYGPRGSMPSGRYALGGGFAAVREFLDRPWDKSLAGGPRRHRREFPPAPVRPDPERHVKDAGPLSRAQGCLLGQVAGDALGSPVEGANPAAIARTYPGGAPRLLLGGGVSDTIPGQPTDDSELALLLARAVVRAQGYDEEEAARHYAWWHGTAPFAVGSTTRAALEPARRIPEGRIAAVIRDAAERIQGQSNGALMRASPLGIFTWRMPPDQAAAVAARDASLTHASPVCRAANAAFVVAVAAAVRTGDSRTAYEEALSWCRKNGSAEVTEALRKTESAPPEDFLSHPGKVLIALQNAFFRLLRGSSLEDGIVETVRCGGDTDTNAAVCGALLGAVQGADAVPAPWRQAILSCRPIEGLPGIRRPRPEPLWPVDVLEIAESLLLIGEKACSNVKRGTLLGT